MRFRREFPPFKKRPRHGSGYQLEKNPDLGNFHVLDLLLQGYLDLLKNAK